MKNNEITAFSRHDAKFMISDFEEALENSMYTYSLLKLKFMDDISPDQILEAVQKSIKVCGMAGINSFQHFKKVYVCDSETRCVQIDWRMTKKGLNLMVMQTPSLNEPIARWLWELADLK